MAPQNLSAFSLNDKKYASYGQQGSALPAEQIGQIVGGFYSTATSTLNTGDFGMLQVDSAGNLMVNLAAGEEINVGTLTLGTLNTLGTVGVVNGGSIVVTKGTIAVGTITAATVNLVESGTLAQVTSVSNLASGTLLTLGTVGVVNAGSIVVTNGTVGALPDLPGGTVDIVTDGTISTYGAFDTGLGTISFAVEGSSGTLANTFSGVSRGFTMVTPALTGTGTATLELLDSLGGTMISQAQAEGGTVYYGSIVPMTTSMNWICTANGTQDTAATVTFAVHYEK